MKQQNRVINTNPQIISTLKTLLPLSDSLTLRDSFLGRILRDTRFSTICNCNQLHIALYRYFDKIEVLQINQVFMIVSDGVILDHSFSIDEAEAFLSKAFYQYIEWKNRKSS